MKVNYVLMYGIPYIRYKEFETFEDVSKFLVNKSIVNYSIFKKLEDKEEIEMIYRDNDIHYLENFVKEQDKKLQQKENIIKEVREYIDEHAKWDYSGGTWEEHSVEWYDLDVTVSMFIKELLEILDKGE